MRLSNAIPLVTKMESLKVSRDKPFELKLYAGIRVGGKIIEETSGEPLAGILIRQFS